MTNIFNTIREKRLQGIPAGLYSVCSSNEMVLEATIRRVSISKQPVLIESTANQVNQDGGYTGMTPSDFVAKLEKLMEKYGVSKDLIVYGGDHLGPYPWRKDSASVAMVKAEVMVRQYVAAGARKIHLDASMALADDESEILDPEIIARRSAVLCKAAEDEYKKLSDKGLLTEPPIYIIGTEVPLPGGETADEEELSLTVSVKPTTADSFELTYSIHKSVFKEYDLSDAWKRVMAVVVQPGVDYDSSEVYQFQSDKIVELKESLQQKKGMFFEAHSTDYQTTESLASLVKEGFIFLKVGPALTLAYREALFGLSQVAKVLGLSEELSSLDSYMFDIMKKNPANWAPYYDKDDAQTVLFSLSDRIRYYWDVPEVKEKVSKLIAALSQEKIATGLLSQYFPRLKGPENIALNIESLSPKQIILYSIDSELERYEQACTISEE